MARQSHSGARLAEVGAAALRLGLTSFGGPVAHLGYFHQEYVVRRRWLDSGAFADLVALCQVLPGPASSQLGIAIGTLRAGAPGGVVAWLGFTLPSALLLAVFAGATTMVDPASSGWVHGLKLAAVAVVAQAVLTMWRGLAPDLRRSAIAVVAAAAAVLAATPLGQVGLIAGGALAGWLLLRAGPLPARDEIASPIGRRAGVALLALFALLLVGLPALAALARDTTIAVADAFFRAGALVFGGGHVVLPLLHASVVGSGWVSESAFLAGYGAAQAVPGPLFTFAAYLGAVLDPRTGGVAGAAVALGAIFLPSFLLVWGALPFWHDLRRSPAAQRALRGTNAAVVGILLAALYRPIFTGAVTSVADAVVSLALFALLALARMPPWAIVILAAASGEGLVWIEERRAG